MDAQKEKETQDRTERQSRTRREAKEKDTPTTESEMILLEPPNPPPTDSETVATQLACMAAYGHHVPMSFREAINSPDSEKWWEAMKDEINMLLERGTWTLTEKIPEGRKPIGNHWTYAIKFGPGGKILRYKARLVAQGFSQIPGIDFTDTFAPTVRLDSLRIILHIAASYGWFRGQDDVTGAFLHSQIDMEVYMRQPEGFEDGTKRFARLLQGLYGIKQGAWLWNKHMKKKLITIGFTQCPADHAVYVRHLPIGITIIAIHVDNMLSIASSLETLAHI